MTHEGRMARGEEKISKGISDIETKYYLDNKPKPTRKGGKKMSEENENKEVVVEDSEESETETEDNGGKE